jgi:methylenetetrahydrofolate reductase (NADPH)
MVAPDKRYSEGDDVTENRFVEPRDDAMDDLRTLIRSAAIELIPLRGAEEKIKSVPVATTITITCSPKFGLTRTLDHVAAARAAGYRVVPHLAARMVGSKEELRQFVQRLGDLGVDDLYVIGGDGAEPLGPFSEAYDVLRAVKDMEHSFSRLGVGCYPEGHPNIGRDALIDALVRKQEYADYMVSQLCFDSNALLGWIRETRQFGIELPLRIGLAAPLQARKLVELALKIGVGDSVKFLTKQHGMIGSLLLGRAYEPADLLMDVLAAPDFDRLDVEGLHLFSFNQVDLTVDWMAKSR